MRHANAGNIDESYFDRDKSYYNRIDSCGAYILGALYDCYSRYGEKGIAITTEKRELLEKIISELRITNALQINPTQNCYFVRYRNAEHLRNRLEEIMYGKGEERMFPRDSDLPRKFYRDFFRGFFESRTRIQRQTSGRGPYLRLRINYNSLFLKKAFEILHEGVGVNIPENVGKIIYIHSQDIEKIVAWMYESCDPEREVSSRLYIRQNRDAFIEVARELREKKLSRSNGEAEDF